MEEELLIIIVVVVIDAYKPPDSIGFEFMALTDWLRLLPASTPVCTKVVGGRVWTGISLSVSTIVKAPHPHATSSDRSSHSRHKFFANTTYIQFNTLHYFFAKTLGIQFNKLHNFFANTTTTIILPISLQILQQQPQQQVLLSLSSVDVWFFFFLFFSCFVASALSVSESFSIFNQQYRMRVLTVHNSDSVQILSPFFLLFLSVVDSLSLSWSTSTLVEDPRPLGTLNSDEDQMSSRFQKRKCYKKKIADENRDNKFQKWKIK